jgi:hypothetical protein
VDTYRLTLTLEKNGRALPGYDPLIRRLTVDQSQSFDEQLATASGDVALPIGQVTAISILLFNGDQPQTFTPGTVLVNAGGLVVLFNAGVTQRLINNASGAVATNRGVAGGT